MINVSHRKILRGVDGNHPACKALFLLLLLAPGSQLSSAEINGQVSQTTESTVRIVTDSELVPNVGDPVQIYFEIPGLGEAVEVGTGKVTAVSAEFIEVRIEHAK